MPGALSIYILCESGAKRQFGGNPAGSVSIRGHVKSSFCPRTLRSFQFWVRPRKCILYHCRDLHGSRPSLLLMMMMLHMRIQANCPRDSSCHQTAGR
jgi:hypothetical protein